MRHHNNSVDFSEYLHKSDNVGERSGGNYMYSSERLICGLLIVYCPYRRINKKCL